MSAAIAATTISQDGGRQLAQQRFELQDIILCHRTTDDRLIRDRQACRLGCGHNLFRGRLFSTALPVWAVDDDTFEAGVRDGLHVFSTQLRSDGEGVSEGVDRQRHLGFPYNRFLRGGLMENSMTAPSSMQAKHSKEDDSGVTVRDATAADIPYIQQIYAHHVLSSTTTFEEVP